MLKAVARYNHTREAGDRATVEQRRRRRRLQQQRRRRNRRREQRVVNSAWVVARCHGPFLDLVISHSIYGPGVTLGLEFPNTEYESFQLFRLAQGKSDLDLTNATRQLWIES